MPSRDNRRRSAPPRRRRTPRWSWRFPGSSAERPRARRPTRSAPASTAGTRHSCPRRLPVAAVGVIGGAGTFRGDHRGAERRLGSAARAEGGTLARLPEPLQDLAADAEGRLTRHDVGDLEELFGVVVAVLIAQSVATLRNRSDAAPLAVADLEDLIEQPPRRRVAVSADGPRILRFDRRLPRFELTQGPQQALEHVDGL